MPASRNENYRDRVQNWSPNVPIAPESFNLTAQRRIAGRGVWMQVF
jgi:hypothetical protein